MKTILLPYDFSKVSQNALQYAVKFADNDPEMQLYLLHISDGSIPKEKLQEKFNKQIAKYKNPLNPEIHTLIKTGELAANIIELQKKFDVDLIIMGTRGAEPGEEDVMTRTAAVVQEADLPVLVVPGKVEKFRLKTISLTIGKEKIADKSPLHLLLDVSRKFNAQVHVLTVHNDESEMGYSEVDESNENTLQYFLEMFYSHHSFSENGDIEKGILEYIEKYDLDMLAIMPKTHLNNNEASEGRLTRLLTLHTNVPLLVLD